MKFVRRLIGASESEERNEDEETSPVQVVDMDVAKSVTVGELRDSIATQHGVQVGNMELMYRGQVLRDREKGLADYVIGSGETLQLVDVAALVPSVSVELNPMNRVQGI